MKWTGFAGKKGHLAFGFITLKKHIQNVYIEHELNKKWLVDFPKQNIRNISI